MAYLLQQVLNALPLAALYGLLSFGYALSFGMTRRVDITFGALFAFAGQIFVLFTDIGWNRYYLILPASLGLGAVAALAYALGASAFIGRHVMRPLFRQSSNALLVASLAVLILLSETARLASGSRDIWLSPFLNQPVVLMKNADGFTASLTVLQIVNTGMMVLLLATSAIVMRVSRLGRLWRAVADDPLAARFCGVDADRVFVVGFLVAGALATIAAILSTAYYGTMDFGAGLVFGVKVALIAAAGGQSYPLYAALGAAAVALAETLWSGYGPIVWKDFVITGSLVILLIASRRERLIP